MPGLQQCMPFNLCLFVKTDEITITVLSQGWKLTELISQQIFNSDERQGTL